MDSHKTDGFDDPFRDDGTQGVLTGLTRPNVRPIPPRGQVLNVHAPVRRYRFSIVTCAVLLCANALASTAQELRRPSSPIRAVHVGASAVGVAALFFLDEPFRSLLQSHRTDFADNLAVAFRQLGEVGIVYPASLGVLGIGLLASDDELKRAGTQMAVSLTLAAGVTIAGKFLFGRVRPDAGEGAWAYEPFTGTFEKSLPSGHTALAFALATTLADFTDSDVAKAFIYAAAVGTGWSRMNDDRHWLSDVGAGALIGIATSKLVTGRWTLLGIKTPGYLADPGVEPVSLGELGLGAAAGVTAFQLGKVIVSSANSTAPFVAPIGMRAWGVGLRVGF